MRPVLILYFLTLVSAVAWAAPETDLKPAPLTFEESNSTSGQNINKETIQTTEAPQAHMTGKWTDSWGSTNFGLGEAFGQMNKDRDSLTVTTFHLQRTQSNLDESAQEFGLALSTVNLFMIDWGFRKDCCFTSFAAPWRPFYKIGVAGIYDPEDQLANFVDYERYFIQVSGGLGNFLNSHRLLKLETGIRLGALGTNAFLQVFYAFPD